MGEQLRVNEYARRKGFNPQTVYKMLKALRLPFVLVGNRPRIDEDAIPSKSGEVHPDCLPLVSPISDAPKDTPDTGQGESVVSKTADIKAQLAYEKAEEDKRVWDAKKRGAYTEPEAIAAFNEGVVALERDQAKLVQDRADFEAERDKGRAELANDKTTHSNNADKFLKSVEQIDNVIIENNRTLARCGHEIDDVIEWRDSIYAWVLDTVKTARALNGDIARAKSTLLQMVVDIKRTLGEAVGTLNYLVDQWRKAGSTAAKMEIEKEIAKGHNTLPALFYRCNLDIKELIIPDREWDEADDKPSIEKPTLLDIPLLSVLMDDTPVEDGDTVGDSVIVHDASAPDFDDSEEVDND